MSENIKHLRSILEKMTIEDTTEAIEFLEAIETEMGGDNSEKYDDNSEKYDDIVFERDNLQEEVDDIKGQLEEWEEWIDPDELIEIDCGIGVIKLLYPDNVKLQGIVDDFKNVLEKKAMFGAGV